ncbi:hypothetical protein LPJ57_009085, partial [Coemansia sp. RSA 486]
MAFATKSKASMTALASSAIAAGIVRNQIGASAAVPSVVFKSMSAQQRRFKATTP